MGSVNSRARDPESKRRAILDAAEELFAANGYGSTPTSLIGQRAGVSEGIVFHHFGSKIGVLQACANEQAQALIDSMRPHGEPLDYQAMVAAVFDWVATHPMLRAVIAEGDDQILAALRRGWAKGIVPAVAEFLAAEQAAGRCIDRDPVHLARMQFALVGEALTLNHDRRRVGPAVEVQELAGYLVALTR